MIEFATLGVLTLVEPLDALARLVVTSALGVILVELAVGLGSVLGISRSEPGDGLFSNAR